MKILMLEYWGLGDLIFASSVLRRFENEDHEVFIAAKPYARSLLQNTFPKINFISFDPHWTKFRKKYNWMEWNWTAFLEHIMVLRELNPDIVCSVRKDPRDHVLMKLSGAANRYGVAHPLTARLLNHPLNYNPNHHRVESWWEIEKEIFGTSLRLPPYLKSNATHKFSTKKTILFHLGARIFVRRWGIDNFKFVIQKIKEQFDFNIYLVPDPDGYGRELEPYADKTFNNLSISELVDLIASVNLFVGNDSGPAHIASAVGVPTVTIFGPTSKVWFRPFGEHNLVIQRDICNYRPCFDYCKYSVPICMDRLKPNEVWDEISKFIEFVFSVS